MTLVTTTVADDDANPPAMGDLGKFRVKKLKKLIKPLTSIAKPLLSMGQGGGLLTAMGPWGWAAGAALAAGGALAAKHRKKKQRARQQQAEQAAMEPPPAPPTPSYAYPSPTMDQPTEPMPETYQPAPAFVPQEMPSEYTPPPEPALPMEMIPAPEIPEVQAVIDPEPVNIAGLNGQEINSQSLDWKTISLLAGFSLGTWWILSNHKPKRTKRR